MPRGDRSIRALGLFTLIAASCGGGSDPLFTDTTPPDAAETLTVGPNGGQLAGPDGLTLDVLPGTFEEDIEVTIGAGDLGSLPEGAAAVGSAFSVVAPSPGVPVVLEVPIPAGAATDHLLLARRSGDGSIQLLAGAIEDDRYVVATPGFSDFGLVTYDPRTLLTALGSQIPDSSEAADILDEYGALVAGTRDAPIARSARVVGPGEVPIGESATMTAIDFLTATPYFTQYQWTAFGPLTVSGAGATATAVGVEEGRGVIAVEVTDPRLGVSAYASRRVFITAAGEPFLTLSADRAVYVLAPLSPELRRLNYVAIVTATPSDTMTPPFSYLWSSSDGREGTIDGGIGPATLEIEIPFENADASVTATVTDAAGRTATATLGLPVRWDSCNQAYALVGPRTATAGEAVSFEILSAPYAPTDPDLAVSPAATIARSGSTVTLVFGEPGLASITLTGDPLAVHPEQGELFTDLCGGPPTGTALVKVEGAPAPVQVRLVDPPAEAAVDTAMTITAEATGGVVATPEGLVPYTGTIDWGDGIAEDIVIPATSAALWNPLGVGHSYAEPGTYLITATVTIAGLTDTVTHTVIITDAAGRFEGPVVEYEAAASDTFTVTRNRVVVLIESGAVELRRFNVSWEQRYVTFSTGGETHIADCLGVGSRVIDGAELTIDDSGAIQGSVRLHWVVDDTGPECPFGGVHIDEIWTGAVSGAIEGDVLTLVLVGSGPGRAQETLTVVAPAT